MTNPSTQDTDGLSYKLVPLTAQVVSVSSTMDSQGLIGTFRNAIAVRCRTSRSASVDIIGVFDLRSLLGGLFIPPRRPRAGNFVDIPTRRWTSTATSPCPMPGR